MPVCLTFHTPCPCLPCRAYSTVADEHDHDHGHGDHGHGHHPPYEEPKTFVDYVKPEYWYR